MSDWIIYLYRLGSHYPVPQDEKGALECHVIRMFNYLHISLENYHLNVQNVRN